MGKQWKQWQTLFSWAPKSLQTVTAVVKLKDTCSLEEKLTNLDSILKSRDSIADKGWSSQSYGFSSSHVWMWELTHNESWMPKKWCFRTAVEKTLESPMDCKKIKPVNPKRNQPLIFIGRTEWSWSSNILAIWCKGPTNWKRPWCWERRKAEGEEGNRGWGGWLVSQIQ